MLIVVVVSRHLLLMDLCRIIEIRLILRIKVDMLNHDFKFISLSIQILYWYVNY